MARTRRRFISNVMDLLVEVLKRVADLEARVRKLEIILATAVKAGYK